MKKNYDQLSVEEKICTRIHILENLDKLINESIYYRNNSSDINSGSSITIGNITESLIKKKIL